MHSGDGVDFVSTAEGGGGDLTEAEVFDFALGFEGGHGGDGVFDGRDAVDAVAVVEVDGGDVEALKGFGAGFADVGRVGAHAAVAVFVDDLKCKLASF